MKKTTHLFFYALVVVWLSTFSSHALSQEDPLAAIKAALPGELINDPLSTKWNTNSKNFVLKQKSANIIGGSALNAKVKRKPAQVWEASINSPVNREIKKGEELAIYFWARTDKPPKNNDTGELAVSVGRNAPPWDSVFSQNIKPSKEWQLYNAKGVAKDDFPASKVRMTFNFGFAKQTIEIGQVYLVTLGNKQASAVLPKAKKTQGKIADQANGLFTFAYGDGVTSKKIKAGSPNGDALQVHVKQAGKNSWDAAAGANKLAIDINKGDKVMFEFWARSLSEESKVTAFVQRADAPYTPMIQKVFELSPEWAKYTVDGTAGFALNSGEAGLSMHLGHLAQSVELGQFEVKVLR